MKVLKLYTWFTGSVNDFTKPFQNNETLLKQAKAFWSNLEGFSIVIMLLFIVGGVLFAVDYYTRYNNKPGRHYTPKCWLWYMLYTFLSVLVITFLTEYLAVTPKLDGAFMLEIKVAILNALYAIGLYFVVSVIWCNTAPTNAYRLFKIK